MNTQQLSLWVEAESLNDIPLEELLLVRDDIGSAIQVAALISELYGSGIDALSDDEHWEKMLNLKVRCILEIIRRRYANTRPKLFYLRDMPITKLVCSIEDPEFGIKEHKEYLRGAMMCFRSRTGMELTEEEFVQMLKKSFGSSNTNTRKSSLRVFPELE